MKHKNVYSFVSKRKKIIINGLGFTLLWITNYRVFFGTKIYINGLPCMGEKSSVIVSENLDHF